MSTVGYVGFSVNGEWLTSFIMKGDSDVRISSE